MKDIQLSVSLLASDRPAALERCLDSLKPLLMKVPSELIVVATGTDDKVREIVSDYTDQIISFTWCNDFSAARNAGLKFARGEWFLYIDDDEWFEDTTEICDFFLTGEYHKFGVATYKQRNYVDWQGMIYSDFQVVRLIKLVTESHFVNPIHEELVPRYAPCKELNAYVHHYGYVKSKENAATEKTSRNLTLLLEDIRNRPFYVKNYVQIVQEYREAHDWENAEQYCRKGLKYCRNSELLPFRRWLQADLIEIIYAKEVPGKAEEEILLFLQQYKPCEMVRLIAYLTLNKIYIKLDRPKDSLLYGIKYEKTMAYMDKNPELWRQQECGYLSELRIKHPNTLYQIRINCVEQALSCKKKEEAIYFLKLLPWDEEIKIQGFYYIFDFFKDTYTELFEDILQEFPAESSYLLLLQVMNAENLEKEKREELFEQCMTKAQLYSIQFKIIKKAILCETDITKLVTFLELTTWEKCSYEIVDDFPDIELYKVWNAVTILMCNARLHALLLAKALYERDLTRGYPVGQAFINILAKYSECILMYYKEQYCTEMFQPEKVGILPKECRFGIYLSEALEKLKLMKLSESIQLLRIAVPLNTKMTGTIHELIRLITNILRNPAFDAGKEFSDLAIRLKTTLSDLIVQGKYDEAMSILPQLTVLLPEDLELLRIKQRLLKLIN